MSKTLSFMQGLMVNGYSYDENQGKHESSIVCYVHADIYLKAYIDRQILTQEATSPPIKVSTI